MGKSKSRGEVLRLTNAQQNLVRANMGLVAVHLKRHVTNLSVPQRDREYDDLFQEGCLGLMQSAARWNPASGIQFAAYALPRIHNAVSLALKCKFATIYVPPRSTNRTVSRRADDPTSGMIRPRLRSLSDGHWKTIAAVSAPAHPGDAHETIGDRLREKLERAMARSELLLGNRPSTRGDRDSLMRLIVRERLLVPNAEAQRSLRQIARETESSYARVAQCAAQLTAGTRRWLDGDPEFRELVRLARTHPDGYMAPLDKSVERGVARAAADECVRRFQDGDEQERSSLVYAVVRRSETDVARLLHRAVTAMSGAQRSGILADAVERDESRRATPRHTVASRARGRRRETSDPTASSTEL